MGKTKRGKGTKLLAVADRTGLPVAVYPARASPHEGAIVAATLANRFVEEAPPRLIGERAYDSDPLTAVAVGNPRPRPDGHSDGTRDAGRWSGYLPGWATSAGW